MLQENKIINKCKLYEQFSVSIKKENNNLCAHLSWTLCKGINSNTESTESQLWVWGRWSKLLALEVHSDYSQTSNMEFFAKITHSQYIFIFIKNLVVSNLDRNLRFKNPLNKCSNFLFAKIAHSFLHLSH